MTTHKFYKAQDLASHIVEPVTIIIEEPIPSQDPALPLSQAKIAYLDAFNDNADRLADVLCKTLPGGTLDRLIANLLERRASMLIVPMFK